MNRLKLLRRYMPILDWRAKCNSKTFTNDLIVAGIVTVMLIPQSLICRFLEESE
jgi:SulP family sulfate permease